MSETPTITRRQLQAAVIAPLYRETGIGRIGHLISRSRDGVFCDGHDPRTKLAGEHASMSGAPRCTLRYRYQGDAPGQD